VYNASRLRHFVPDRTSLSYITYRRLIRKHRRRHSKRVPAGEAAAGQSVPDVLCESTAVDSERRDRMCSAAEDAVPTAESRPTLTTSSSLKDPTPVNSCTEVVSRSSFSIMRLLSLSEDSSCDADVKLGTAAAGDDARILSASVGRTPAETVAETVASQDARVAAAKDSWSVGCGEVKPAPVHFKKRMINSASVSQPTTSAVSEPAIIGKSVTPCRSFTVYQDDTPPPTSTPPAKVGIVISHGRAMTLQDKLQMTTNSARRSPTSSGGRSCAVSVASPLGAHNRQVTPVAPRCKLKRRQKPVVKRSLITPAKVRVFSSSFRAVTVTWNDNSTSRSVKSHAPTIQYS